jgi:hypothetical protein
MGYWITWDQIGQLFQLSLWSSLMFEAVLRCVERSPRAKSALQKKVLP